MTTTPASTFAPDVPTFQLEIASIVVPEDRQRKDAEPDAQLIASIERYGVLNAIIVRGGNILVAGERRLNTCTYLKHTHIPAKNFEDLSPSDTMLIELQENLARKQLSWQDEAAAVLAFHNYTLEKNKGEWTQLATANALGISQSGITIRLTVGAELSDPKVAGCATLTAAHNFVINRAQRAIAASAASGSAFAKATLAAMAPAPVQTREENTAAIMAELAGEAPAKPSRPDSTEIAEIGRRAMAELEQQRIATPAERLPSGPILTASFLDWAPTYDGVLFDVIHCDFPYGKNYSGAHTTSQAEMSQPVYDDSPDVLHALLDCFLANQHRFAADQAHCLFWHDKIHEASIIDKFTAAGWRHVSPNPIIWTKGNAGAPGDHKRSFRHCYETAHLFSRGDRPIVKMVQDHFAAPVVDGTEGKLHLSQKSVSMLKHFLSGLVDEHSRVLDPTCGSGSAIAAANLLGVDYSLGIEMDEENATIARFFVERKLQDDG